jgi:glutathione S-transferase
LAPSDPDGQAKVASWVLAALNSVEPHTAMFTNLDTFYAGQAWAAEYRPQAEKMVVSRLTSLAEFLGDQAYLVGDRFTAGDLMMVMITRELVDSGMLARFPTLDAHRARCEARPAFQKSLADQLATFKEHEPA